jgi:hypothetical protein
MDYTKVKANFEIKEDNLDPNIVTKKLGISPSETHFKGDPITKSRNWTVGFWVIRTEYEESLNINLQIEKIYVQLKEKVKELIDIKKKYNVYLNLSIWVDIENGQAPKICIKEEILSFMSKIGGTIDVDLCIYS